MKEGHVGAGESVWEAHSLSAPLHQKKGYWVGLGAALCSGDDTFPESSSCQGTVMSRCAS